MAKKQAKKAKGAGKVAAQDGPTAALYHLDPGTPKGDAVRAVLAAQGIRAKTVRDEMLGDPVGAIAGLPGFKHSSKPFAGEVPDVEFLLLHNVAGERLNVLLASLREADASVGCKAQVTQYNRLWPFATLVKEVSREHQAMTAAAADNAIVSDDVQDCPRKDPE